MVAFGNELRKARIISELSLRQVADKLNITIPAVHHYETGLALPTLTNFVKLIDLYKCPVTPFFILLTEEEKSK